MRLTGCLTVMFAVVCSCGLQAGEQPADNAVSETARPAPPPLPTLVPPAPLPLLVFPNPQLADAVGRPLRFRLQTRANPPLPLRKRQSVPYIPRLAAPVACCQGNIGSSIVNLQYAKVPPVEESTDTPQQYTLEARIVKVTSKGDQLISAPRITMLEGQPSRIQISNGEHGQISLKLHITSRREDARASQPSPPPLASWAPSQSQVVTAGSGIVQTQALSTPAASPSRSSRGWVELVKHEAVEDIIGTQSEEEVAFAEIRRRLKSRADFHYVEESLGEVLKDISARAGVNIVIDTEGLAEEGLTVDSQVSLDAVEISFDSALELLLSNVRLTYIYKHEVLLVTSSLRSKGKLSVVSYAVADLVGDDKSTSDKFATIVDTIQLVVDPNSWSDVGGGGAIRAFPTASSLIIRQTQDVHERIADLLSQLRRVKAGTEEDRSSN